MLDKNKLYLSFFIVFTFLILSRQGASQNLDQINKRKMDNQDYVILAGGCFWGMEELFRKFEGVVDTEVGYSGGLIEDPVYGIVKTGASGHAESVKVVYDPSKTTLEKILHFFFKIHDPTTLNRQGNDIGTQYRSTIFFRTSEQELASRKVIDEVNNLGRFKSPIVTTLEKEQKFYPAESYHQDYLQKNPNGYTCHFIRE